jgi:transcription initiation factor TFIIIB Brf1 subunit/transcription initiation factor TFIIB
MGCSNEHFSIKKARKIASICIQNIWTVSSIARELTIELESNKGPENEIEKFASPLRLQERLMSNVKQPDF